MVDLLLRHGGEVTADTAGIYRQTHLIREMLAGGKADPAEVLRFVASGGAPEIVGMALEQIDWPRDDPRWFRILTEPLYLWRHIPWLHAGNKDFDRATYLTCFRLILQRCEPNVTGSFGRTALHEVAAMRDHITEEETASFAEALLNAGAKVGGRDDILKSTALGWACRWGRATVAGLMLEQGRRSGRSGRRTVGTAASLGGEAGPRGNHRDPAKIRRLISRMGAPAPVVLLPRLDHCVRGTAMLLWSIPSTPTPIRDRHY
jgi:ankyrin repeat protein